MRVLRPLLTILIITLITLALAEVALRLAAPALPGSFGVVARYITTGQPYTQEWTPAWRENRDHYYTLRPNITDALQYGSPSVSFSLTTHKLWDDGLAPDEGIGFRTAPVDFGVDAVVVGDSFAFCFTEQADCWVDIWAREQNLGVVNLGTPVTGSISHAKMVSDFAAPLKPPLVIWQWFGNDFYDDYALHVWRGDIAPMGNPFEVAERPQTLWTQLARHTVIGGLIELVATGKWSGAPEESRIYEAGFSAPYPGGILQFAKAYEMIALNVETPAGQYGHRLSTEALIQAKAEIEAWGGELKILMIPPRETVYSDIVNRFIGNMNAASIDSSRLFMLGLCGELQLDCLDPLTELQARGKTTALYYADDMHLNAAGNAAIAEILAAWLAEDTE